METHLMLGNEAVARGAWEAGVQVAAAYPGTPSTEIVTNLARYDGVYAEWSTNEKVAYEVAFGRRDGRRPRPHGDEERGRQRRGRSADQLGLHGRQRRARRLPRRRPRHGQRHDRAGRPLLRPHQQHADARAGGQPGVLRVRQARLRHERGVRRAGDGAPEHPDGAPEEHRPLRRRDRGRRRRRPGRPDAAGARAPAAGPQDREILPAAEVLAAAAPQPARARRAAATVRRGERGLRRPGAGRAGRRSGAAAGRRHGEDRRRLRRGGVPQRQGGAARRRLPQARHDPSAAGRGHPRVRTDRRPAVRGRGARAVPRGADPRQPASPARASSGSRSGAS